MEKPFEHVAVVGSGILGTQIAMLAAYAGYKVCVYDIRKGAFDETYAKLYADLKAKGIDPFIAFDKWEECKKNIRFAANLDDALKDADLVEESVTEDVEIKREVFKQMGEKAPAKAIFATNSSSLPVSRMEASSGRPERCINIHFYFPLQGLNMADLMAGTKTLPDAMQKGEDWIRSLGVVPLRVNKEALGFCFNSVWRAIKKRTLYMWANDIADFRDIDRAWRIFSGMKVGPFALMDTVGLDTVFNIEMSYYADSKDPGTSRPMHWRR